MIKNFLNKEIKLCLSPLNYVFLIFGSMVLIPNYPCYIGFFYICLSEFLIFQNSEANKDLFYSMILPVSKKDIVKSRCIICFLYEITALIISIPFAVLSQHIFKEGNAAGIDCNLAFYGLQLVVFSVYHFVFFTHYYKRADKSRFTFIFALIAYFVSYLIVESPFYLENVIDSNFIYALDFRFDPLQIPLFIAGVVIYIVFWILSYRISAKRFEKVDL